MHHIKCIIGPFGQELWHRGASYDVLGTDTGYLL